MKPVVKKALAALGVVGALASVVAGREQPSALPEHAPKVETRLSAAVDPDLSRISERVDAGEVTDAFAPRNFAPIVPAEPQKAEKPAAPPLPFRYVGRKVEDGKVTVFLERGEETVVAAAGQKLGEYRVDRITDQEIRFTYLPMKTKQVLPL